MLISKMSLKRTLSAFLFLSFLLVSGGADAAVQVDNIKVQIDAESGLKARDLAIQEAKRKAFRAIMENDPSLGYDIKSRGMPSDKDLEFATDTFSVESEKISPQRYVGNLSITFSEEGLERIVSGDVDYDYIDASKGPQKKNAANSTQQKTDLVEKPLSRDVILVPCYISSDESFLWTPNPWRAFWQQQPQNEIFNTLIPLGDLQDVMSASIEDFMTGLQSPLSVLFKRYQKPRLVFASLKQFTTGEDLDATSSEGMIHEAELLVKIFSDGKLVFASQPHPLTGISKNDIFYKAHIEVIRLIQDVDGSKANMQNAAIQTLRISAKFSSFMQWQKIRKSFDIPEVSDFSVSNLTTKSAVITLKAQASVPQLAAAFAAKGLKFREGAPGRYSIKVKAPSAFTP